MREIEGIRERLETNFQELERRMPAPAIWGKRLAGIAVGGGVGALVLRSLLKRGAKGRSSTVEAAEPSPDGNWKLWFVLGAGALVVLHLAALRQLRRLSRALPEDSL